MDLVYIVKDGDYNPDLRYSLRSVEKFVPYDNIWIVGYKPSWVKNVKYLPVVQEPNDKWNNSNRNVIEACKCPDISDNFVLMNDDFFAIKPIKDLEESLNYSLGRLSKSIIRHSDKTTKYFRAFGQLRVLLAELGIKPLEMKDYESHTPIILNKNRFLMMMELDKVKSYINSGKILHKRSVYKNLFPDIGVREYSEDVKIKYDSEVDRKCQVCGWISVYDEQVDNIAYRKLNRLLQNLFPEKSSYENDNYIPPVIPEDNVIEKKKIVILPDGRRLSK